MPSTQHFPAEQIQAWIAEIRQNGTKVLLSINDKNLGLVPDVDAFAKSTAETAAEWGVDGLDLDYEPPEDNPTLLQVTSALRSALQSALGRDPLITAPIYAPWQAIPDFLKSFAAELDLVMTMDYSDWPGVPATKEYFGQYAEIIGSTEKLVIGVSCERTGYSFTPLEDVEAITPWEPEGGRKGGLMLYTFSYDIPTRPLGGTGFPDGTWTKTIHELLP